MTENERSGWAVPGSTQATVEADEITKHTAQPIAKAAQRTRSGRVVIALATAAALAVAVVAFVLTRQSDHPESAATKALHDAATRSLALNSFTVQFSGAGLDPANLGTIEYQGPDRVRFTPDPSNRREPSLNIGRTTYLRERNGRLIAYENDDRHVFDNTTFMLRAIAAAKDVTQHGDTFVFDDHSAGHAIRIEVTVRGGVVAHVLDHTDTGPVVLDYSGYGTTSVDIPDPSIVDSPTLQPCRPPGEQDPNVLCVNSN